jgi:hypothetical protein
MICEDMNTNMPHSLDCILRVESALCEGTLEVSKKPMQTIKPFVGCFKEDREVNQKEMM